MPGHLQTREVTSLLHDMILRSASPLIGRLMHLADPEKSLQHEPRNFTQFSFFRIADKLAQLTRSETVELQLFAT